MSKQMTAVEWLVEQLKERGYAGEFPPHLLFQQAKEMEKDQIMNSWVKGVISDGDMTAEQYYNETFKTK